MSLINKIKIQKVSRFLQYFDLKSSTSTTELTWIEITKNLIFDPLCMSQNNVNSDLTVITNCNFTRICQTWFILTHPRRFQKPDKKCNSLRCMKIRMLFQKWITPKCTKRVLSVCNNTTVTQLVNFPKQYFKPCRYKKERRKKPFE